MDFIKYENRKYVTEIQLYLLLKICYRDSVVSPSYLNLFVVYETVAIKLNF